MLKKFYDKEPVGFTLIWIGVYCVAMSAADGISLSLGMTSCISLPVILLLSAVIFAFMKRYGLLKLYGLCKPEVPASSLLFYIPLLILITANLWSGTEISLSAAESVLYALTMLFVGFFEEIIFRGFLLHALMKQGTKTAVAISSITFGIGHIINLFNGSGAELLENILQILSAISVGFMFVMLFLKSKSLIPCIITHGLFNALSVISAEGSQSDTVKIITCLIIVLLSTGYGLYLSKAVTATKEQ